jgi:hypothetical protein
MPKVYIACWTMKGDMFNNLTTDNRVDMFGRITRMADTYLKILEQAGGPGTKMLIVPEYVYTLNAQANTLLTRDQKHDVYNRLIDISKRYPELIIIAGTIPYGKGNNAQNQDIYSVCPMLFGGQIRAKLYKRDDDNTFQINGTFRTKTDHGKNVPLVTINNLTIGVDICMDYNNNRLENYLTANHLQRPDIHVQISGTNGAGPPSAQAEIGGVYVHCNLSRPTANVDNGASAYSVTGRQGAVTQTQEIQPIQTFIEGAGRLKFFEETL